MSSHRRARLLAAVALLTVPLAAPAATAHPPAAILVRQSVPALTQSERQAYVQAVLALKHAPSPYRQDRSRGWSWYDTFVHWHEQLSDCGATELNLHPSMMGHAGPMFLAWHREFLNLFQQALDAVSGRPVPIPYWDWADPSAADPGEWQAVFRNDFMGPNGNPADGYAVDEGPFTRTTWPLRVWQPHGLIFTAYEANTPYLSRDFSPALPSQSDVRTALSAPSYDVAPYDERSDPAASFREAVEGFTPVSSQVPVSVTGCAPDRPTDPSTGDEGTIPVNDTGALPGGKERMHNLVHLSVGGTFATPQASAQGLSTAGTMRIITDSPNDPVFFLHHAQIDRLWALWQAHHANSGYQPAAEADYPRNALHSPMFPFDTYGITVTPADVLDTRQLGYVYAAPAYDPTAGTVGAGPATASSLASLMANPDWVCR